MTSELIDVTDTFEREHKLWIDQQLLPQNILSLAAAKCLQQRGIESSQYLATLKKSFQDAVARGSDSIEVVTGNPLIDEVDWSVDLDFDGPLVQAVVADIEAAVQTRTAGLFDELRTTILDGVLKDPGPRLLEIDINHESFARRLRLTWHEPLELFAIQLSIAFEIGEAWSKKLRAQQAEDSPVVDVVTRLHARCVQAAKEVEVLLKNGFADGALARWRTIHELSVVALFVAHQGPDMALRYLDHVSIDHVKAADQYQRAAPLLGYDMLEDSELAALHQCREELKQKHGPTFAQEYGWAASALDKKPLNFASIEEAVSMERFRPYFKMASNPVHAGANGLHSRLGILGKDVLLAGPSNAHLHEAARLTALSLAQITACLLNLRINVDSGVWTAVLSDLSSRIEASAIRVQQQIELDESKRNCEAGPLS